MVQVRRLSCLSRILCSQPPHQKTFIGGVRSISDSMKHQNAYPFFAPERTTSLPEVILNVLILIIVLESICKVSFQGSSEDCRIDKTFCITRIKFRNDRIYNDGITIMGKEFKL